MGRPQSHDPQYLLDQVREFYEEHGRRPTRADMRDWDGPCPEAYNYRWRTMPNVMASAGLPAEEVQSAQRGGRLYRDEDLHEWARLWLHSTGELPTSDGFTKFPDSPSALTVYDRYDTWRSFLVDAVGEEVVAEVYD